MTALARLWRRLRDHLLGPNHRGADIRYAAELHRAATAPVSVELPPTRQERHDERAALAALLNDIETELFAGLNEVMARVLEQLNLSYVDLMPHDGWVGARELVDA